MAVKLYAVALTEPHEKAWKALEANWPGSFITAGDRLAFITVDGASVARQIKDALGIAAGEATGLVTQLHTGEFAGTLPADVVKWVTEVEASA